MPPTEPTAADRLVDPREVLEGRRWLVTPQETMYALARLLIEAEDELAARRETEQALDETTNAAAAALGLEVWGLDVGRGPPAGKEGTPRA